MRPVMMEQLTSDREAYRACLASVLDMDLDVFPVFEGLAAPMQWSAWLGSELNICTLVLQYGVVPEPPGLWIAHIGPSPYQGLHEHQLVLAGSQIVHDPHPEASGSFVYPDASINRMELLLPLDPGEPSGRFACS